MKTKEALEQIKTAYSDAIVEEVTFKEQTTVVVKAQKVKTILAYLKEIGFETLIDLTAVDYLEPEVQTKVIYHLLEPKSYDRIRIATWVQRDEKIDSVTSLWSGANWYERELFDLYGILFEGHPDLQRILLPDGWTGHPLRKDYALTEEAVQFKNGVKPKVPSEIIPHVKTRTRKS